MTLAKVKSMPSNNGMPASPAHLVAKSSFVSFVIQKKEFFFLFLPLHPKSHGDKQQTTRVMNTRRPLLWHECCSPFFVDWLVLRQSLSLNDCVLLQPVITKLLSLWLDNSVLVVLLLSPPLWFPCTVCSLVCCCHSLCYAVFVGVCRCPFTRCMLIN